MPRYRKSVRPASFLFFADLGRRCFILRPPPRDLPQLRLERLLVFVTAEGAGSFYEAIGLALLSQVGSSHLLILASGIFRQADGLADQMMQRIHLLGLLPSPPLCLGYLLGVRV